MPPSVSNLASAPIACQRSRPISSWAVLMRSIHDGVGVAEVGDVDQHRLVDALRPALAQRDRGCRADRLAHGEGALDLECIHHLDDASCVVLDGGLPVDMIGMAVARIVDGDGAEVRRQRLQELDHDGRALLVDVAHHDDRPAAAGPPMDVAGEGLRQAALDAQGHTLLYSSLTLAALMTAAHLATSSRRKAASSAEVPPPITP